MTDKKIIAVVGATGAQGGGLVRAILEDKESPFLARALTRNVNSDKAKELAGAGRHGESQEGFHGCLWRILRDLLLGALLSGEGR